jgi:hypothetical protein
VCGVQRVVSLAIVLVEPGEMTARIRKKFRIASRHFQFHRAQQGQLFGYYPTPRTALGGLDHRLILHYARPNTTYTGKTQICGLVCERLRQRVAVLCTIHGHTLLELAIGNAVGITPVLS